MSFRFAGVITSLAPATGAQSLLERTVPVTTCPMPTTGRAGAAELYGPGGSAWVGAQPSAKGVGVCRAIIDVGEAAGLVWGMGVLSFTMSHALSANKLRARANPISKSKRTN